MSGRGDRERLLGCGRGGREETRVSNARDGVAGIRRRPQALDDLANGGGVSGAKRFESALEHVVLPAQIFHLLLISVPRAQALGHREDALGFRLDTCRTSGASAIALKIP